MYILCRIRTRESNGSVGGHPFDIIKRSYSMSEIVADMKKRALDGCPISQLKIMKEIDYAFKLDIDCCVKEDSDDSN